LSGGIAAHFLGLRRKAGAGWVVLGANAVGRALGSLLVEVGSEVLLIDHHDGLVKAAEDEGLRALSLNALEATTGEKAQLDTRIGALSVTSNEEVNFLFAEKSRLRVKTIRYPVALRSWLQGVTPEMVRLFGAEVDIALWAERLDAGTAAVWWWTFNGGRNRPSILTGGQPDPTYLPLVHKRRSNAEPVTDQVRFRKKSEVAFLVDLDAKAAAEQTLRAAGWEPSGKPRKRTRVEKPTEPAAPEPADAAPSNAPADEPSAAAPEDAA
jgi:hypothetical protein